MNNQKRYFTYNEENMDFNLEELWEYKYSNIYNMQEVIAEFLVEKALGMTKSFNTDYWTLYDIYYRGIRIEVKETSYYHPWNEGGNISKQRVFSITKANSNYEAQDQENKYERQNDIHVFCLNIGYSKEESNPMKLDNWEFYVIPTKVINENCGDNKTISLGRVKQLTQKTSFDELKVTIDSIVEEINSNKIVEEK